MSYVLEAFEVHVHESRDSSMDVPSFMSHAEADIVAILVDILLPQ